MISLRITALMMLVLLQAACVKNDGADGSKQAQEQAENQAARVVDLVSGPPAAQTLKLDTALADRGQALFDDKSCSDCHTLGEADMAPDLLGVLDRRTLPWLTMQITQPEWMKENDPVTKGLIEEFDLDMIGTGVSDEDARAIIHFLLRESGE